MDITPDMAIARFIELRTKKSEMVAAHDAAVLGIDEKMASLKAWLLQHCAEHNTDGLRTSAGTLARKVKVSWKIEDRGLFLDFVKTTGNVELLESRVSSSSVDVFVSQNPGVSVPGVFSQSEYTLTISAPKK